MICSTKTAEHRGLLPRLCSGGTSLSSWTNIPKVTWEIPRKIWGNHGKIWQRRMGNSLFDCIVSRGYEKTCCMSTWLCIPRIVKWVITLQGLEQPCYVKDNLQTSSPCTAAGSWDRSWGHQNCMVSKWRVVSD